MQPNRIKAFLKSLQASLEPSSVQSIDFKGQMVEDSDLLMVSQPVGAGPDMDLEDVMKGMRLHEPLRTPSALA